MANNMKFKFLNSIFNDYDFFVDHMVVFYTSGIMGISAGNQNLQTTGPKDSLRTIIVQV